MSASIVAITTAIHKPSARAVRLGNKLPMIRMTKLTLLAVLASGAAQGQQGVADGRLIRVEFRSGI